MVNTINSEVAEHEVEERELEGNQLKVVEKWSR